MALTTPIGRAQDDGRPRTTGSVRTTGRREGLTHVLDKGLSLFALESLIQTAGDAVDIVKLGWGTSYVSDGVKAKVRLCRSAGIHLSPGGTLLEICEYQGRITDYMRWLERLG